ncbi:MAG: phenylalanine--tRNA ligase subunit beta [Deltaproteobacteria bacterium]|nr:phenylalanine--tRNA ligase subunit beta [Deltaproteobacteria bacterium]
MKVPVSWLREFVVVDVSAKQLAERLTLAGIEVERIEELGRDLDGVIVGEIVAVERHPQAERLSVCQVRGAGAELQRVVCGAPNARAGLRVPWAMPGATLAGGRRIAVAEVRGVASAGMLCSEAELGLGGDAGGLLELPVEALTGQPLAIHLGIADSVLEVAVTPNRGDCLSVLGLAREIAALYQVPLRRQRLRLRQQAQPAASLVTVRVDDPAGCQRYTARYIADLRVGPSPAWLQRRLVAADQRPINNIVDITNYVLLERGQPLHAFDYERLPQPHIVVRRAGSDRSIRTLDDRDRELEPADLLITSGEVPVAIAGVMGGAESQVTEETRAVLLESARFDPASIRRTARRLGLRSESSYRFERGVDIEGVIPALERAAALVAELGGGGTAAGVAEDYPAPPPKTIIDLRVPRLEFLVGMPITRSDAAGALRRLGAAVRAKSAQVLAVTPPSYRHDWEREIDLIEEVVRLLGYERVPAALPAVAMSGGRRSPLSSCAADLRQFMAAQGFHEIVSWSFATARMNQLFGGVGVPAGAPVCLRNPVITEEAQLRFSLCPGLLQALRANLNVDEPSVTAFALGKVFWAGAAPAEGHRLAAVLCGSPPLAGLGATRRPFDFLAAKGVLEAVLARLRLLDRVHWERAGAGQPAFHPGQSALAIIDERPLAVVGELHPETEAELGLARPSWLFEFDLERALEYVPRRLVFADLPRFPAVVRDLAIVSEAEFASDQVIRFVQRWNRQVVERVVLFDQYTGPPIPAGKKNLAYSIAYRAANRTLTDDEVNQLHQQLIADLCAALPIELRR